MVDGQSRGWSRRELLAGVGAVGASAVAGCADDSGSETPSGTETGASGSTAAPETESADRDSETETEREATTGETTDDGYERTTVTAYDANGTELATVEVRVADTTGKRYTGLSDTESLPPDEGMWFVHPVEDRQAYVMRGMSFPLDIIFVDANGTVTTIHHAPVDASSGFEGRAKYVLEVNRGWANRTGLEAGDRVVPG
jgi:uncharacterized membrane protein (UPF0127 family)